MEYGFTAVLRLRINERNIGANNTKNAKVVLMFQGGGFFKKRPPWPPEAF
jgi:hypothetical protein